jgi:hypothetical protein
MSMVAMERKTITMATKQAHFASCWKTKSMGQKTLFPKTLREATHDYFLYVFDKCILNVYKQASFTNHPVLKPLLFQS